MEDLLDFRFRRMTKSVAPPNFVGIEKFDMWLLTKACMAYITTIIT